MKTPNNIETINAQPVLFDGPSESSSRANPTGITIKTKTSRINSFVNVFMNL